MMALIPRFSSLEIVLMGYTLFLFSNAAGKRALGPPNPRRPATTQHYHAHWGQFTILTEPVNLQTYTSLGCGRKPMQSVKTHAVTGRANELLTDSSRL